MSRDEKRLLIHDAVARYFSALGTWAEDFKRSVIDHELYDENVFYEVIEQYTVTCSLDVSTTATYQ